MNTTKEGIEVKAGQVWLDLDKRTGGERKVRVLSVSDGRAVVQAVGHGSQPISRISISRMHKMSTGWALVSGAA